MPAPFGPGSFHRWETPWSRSVSVPVSSAVLRGYERGRRRLPVVVAMLRRTSSGTCWYSYRDLGPAHHVQHGSVADAEHEQERCCGVAGSVEPSLTDPAGEHATTFVPEVYCCLPFLLQQREHEWWRNAERPETSVRLQQVRREDDAPHETATCAWSRFRSIDFPTPFRRPRGLR